jgi:hypothetical protein
MKVAELLDLAPSGTRFDGTSFPRSRKILPTTGKDLPAPDKEGTRNILLQAGA